MSDFAGLEPYYTVFVPREIKKADGTSVGRRAAQKIAKKYNLPLVRMGHAVFIDTAEPGRPRK
jgi:3,4-dihydroxy-2-butanone 4-phosphate synthase